MDGMARLSIPPSASAKGREGGCASLCRRQIAVGQIAVAILQWRHIAVSPFCSRDILQSAHFAVGQIAYALLDILQAIHLAVECLEKQ